MTLAAELAAVREQHVAIGQLGQLRRPPPVSESVIRVLDVLGDDLPATEWAERLDVPVEDVRHALAWVRARRGAS